MPVEVVNAPSINAFKNRLDKFLVTQDLYYIDIKAEVSIATPYHIS